MSKLKNVLMMVAAGLFAASACTNAIAEGDQQPGLRDGDVVMCLGDSITASGDQKWGYVEQMRKFVKEWKPEWNVRFYTCGFSGATAGFANQLLEKYYPDVKSGKIEKPDESISNLVKAIDAKPTIVIYMFGVNDVCANNIAKSRPADMTRIMDEYFKGVDRIRTMIQPREIWLSPPLCAGERKTSHKNTIVLEYGPLLAKLAPGHGARVLSTQDDFWNAVEAIRRLYPNVRLSADGIHPNSEGNRLIARAVLKGLGLSGPDKAMPAPISYLPEAERKRIADEGIAWSYDITSVDAAKTNDTTVSWRLYLTNLGTEEAKVSLKTTLPDGFQITDGSVPAELSIKAGESKEIPLTVRGPLTAEKTELLATANWSHNGKSCERIVKGELQAPWLVLVPVFGKSNPYVVDQSVPGWKISINPEDHTPGLEPIDLNAEYPDKRTGQIAKWRKYVNHSPYVNVGSQDGIDFYNLDDCLLQSTAFGVRWVHAPEDLDARLNMHRGNWTPHEAFTVWINNGKAYEGILMKEKDGRVDNPIHLRKGWNRVAFKTSMWQFLWHAIIEIRDAKGLPISGLTYSIEPPKD
ncbi:MAG: GDSL-type esterase/lipase family protein [Victivallales bacterium]